MRALMSDDPARPRLSFDEFKLYYDSTEKVTDRRLETNRWNYSVCIAILVAVAALTKWGLTTTNLLWVGFFAVAVLCMMAILFCSWWIKQIRVFKNLNDAKFGVLKEMAPRVVFDLEHPEAVESYCPFDKEWEKMEKLNALEKVGNIVALKSSNMEYFIPKAFAVLFGGILGVLVIIMILNWPPTKLVQPNPAASTSATGQVK